TFRGCTGITSLPEDLLKNPKLIQFTYAFQNCTGLVNVPVYNLARMTSYAHWNGMFSGCTSLSNESLNNIMISFSTVGATATTNKTLKYLGLTSDQAEICKTLSNYQAFLDAGWVSGY
ncbi:MAG: hypothetical protein ACI4VQ_05775, partial [Clostridia bacterium]